MINIIPNRNKSPEERDGTDLSDNVAAFPANLEFPPDSDRTRNITVGEINQLTQMAIKKISQSVETLVNNQVAGHFCLFYRCSNHFRKK